MMSDGLGDNVVNLDDHRPAPAHRPQLELITEADGAIRLRVDLVTTRELAMQVLAVLQDRK